MKVNQQRHRIFLWLGVVLSLTIFASLSGGCDCGKLPPLERPTPDGGIADVQLDRTPGDKVGQTCTGRCECPQGQRCIDGKCVISGAPAYCCDRDSCPQGAACVDSNGKSGLCGLRTSCKHPCDCPQKNACVDGLCTATNSPVYCCEKSGCVPGKACLSLRSGKGVCGGEGTPCVSACDCQGGLSCINGQCTKGQKPVYCCDSPNCPQGAACESKKGGKSTCGTTSTCASACDCPSGQACNQGRCESSSVPVFCCDRPKECPSGQICYDSAGQRSKCPDASKCSTHCDCTQGLFCEKGSCKKGAKPVFCCDNPGCVSGALCYKKDGSIGVCGNQKCSVAKDCGRPQCQQQGTQCSEVKPICKSDGICDSEVKYTKGICNPKTGTCSSSPTECKTHCDCPQSQACQVGRCVQPPPGRERYCCTKSGCPSGSACYYTDGKPGVCSKKQCKNSQDCPSLSCRAVGLDCEYTSYTCIAKTGDCKKSVSMLKNAECRFFNGKGFCEFRQKTCQSDGDCGVKTCRAASGGSCVQNYESCINGTCRKRSSFVPSSLCDGSGICRPSVLCKAHCDCPQGQGCLNGQCRTTPGTQYVCCSKPNCPSGAVCYKQDGTKGFCPKPTACKTTADCTKPTCRQTGVMCESSSYTCKNGQCIGSTNSMVGLCTPSKGQCSKFVACRVSCDCPQGQACIQSPRGRICAATASPVYCCEKAGCPSKAKCVDRNNTVQTCPIGCTSPCDCPSGQDCVGTKCVTGTQPVYCCDDPSKCPAGQACRDKQNKAATCKAISRPCKTLCDCIQGEICSAGQCKPNLTGTPVYCCDNPGCKAGMQCKNKVGQTGVCPTPCKTNCDCPQGHGCSRGFCSSHTFSSYCCSKAGCPSGRSCQTASGSRGRCPVQTCTSACDCIQGEDCRNGQCVRVSPPVYCCSKPGCASGQICKDKAGKWSTCQGPPACKSACDCPQGKDCYKGSCIRVFPAVYCCSKVGCPSGQACFTEQNKPGSCPGTQCTSACDCKQQGQSCVRGRCVYTSPRTYCCTKPGCRAGQVCEDSNGKSGVCKGASCTSACDCPQGQDCRGGSCIQVSPPVYCCAKGGCRAGRTCIKSDGSQGTCPVQCSTRCDCPQGSDCFSGTCYPNRNAYCCNKSGCPKGARCRNAQGAYSVCGGPPAPQKCKVRCDCPQGQDCQSGKCVRTPNRVYCCNKSGCPPRFACRDTSDRPGFCPTFP